jgi:hypothetical protein
MNTTPTRYMVQVWEYGKWCDYWTVASRANARRVLSAYWQAKRWRAIPYVGR